MSNKLDSLSPESIERMHNDIVTMRASKDAQKQTWSYWPLVVIMLGIIGAGYLWFLSVQESVERNLDLAARKTQREAMLQEQKQREAYYQGMTQQTLSNQEQEAENARVAWENYNQEQIRLAHERKVNDILTWEQQQNQSTAYNNSTAQNYGQPKTTSYWKCTDDTGITTYSIEPCHIEAKRTTPSSTAFKPVQKEIKLVENQNINVLHMATPQTRVVTNTVVVYRDVNNQSRPNKMNSLDCQNAKRAYKFEKGSYFGKSFNRERILNDVVTKCGGWPNDLES